MLKGKNRKINYISPHSVQTVSILQIAFTVCSRTEFSKIASIIKVCKQIIMYVLE